MPGDIIRRPTEVPQVRQPEVAAPPAAPIVDVKPAPTDAATPTPKETVPEAQESAPVEAESVPAAAQDKQSSKPIGVIAAAILVSGTLIGVAVYLGMKN